MKKVFRANLYFMIILISMTVIQFPLAIIYNLIGLTDVRITLFLNHTLLFIVPAIIYVIVTKANIKETFRLNVIPIKQFGIVLLIGLACYPFMGCLGGISSMFFNNNVGDFVDSISTTPLPILLLLIALMPAITEEITMRGIVLSGYDNKTKFKAALMSGILFGIFHLDAQQFLYAAALGFVLAYVVRVTNSIFASMTIHFMVNSISMILSSILLNFNSDVSSNVEEVNLATLSFNDKLSYIAIYATTAILFGGLIYKLIKILEKSIEKRDAKLQYNQNIVYTVEDFDDGENIINIPLLITIFIYISHMTFIFFVLNRM